MTYDNKSHRHEHQVKVRLDDADFDELKECAQGSRTQHSVLAREIILAALEFRRAHGHLPLIDKKHSA